MLARGARLALQLEGHADHMVPGAHPSEDLGQDTVGLVAEPAVERVEPPEDLLDDEMGEISSVANSDDWELV